MGVYDVGECMVGVYGGRVCMVRVVGVGMVREAEVMLRFMYNM